MKNEIIVNDHVWSLVEELYSYYEYRSWWWGLYADGVELYIKRSGIGFEINLGGNSRIYIDVADFHTFWHTFTSDNIAEYDFIEQCVIIADNICIASEKAGLLKYVKP